jgi:hypothetical protein
VIDELRQELDAAGVCGRWQRRALEEARDHLAESEGGFGDPREIARDIAAVVATTQTRQAALVAFGGLVAAGLACVAAFGLSGSADITVGGLLGITASAAIVVASQIAFVAGVFMAWRALRLRAPARAAELVVVRRRAAVALSGAAVTAVAWIVYAHQYDDSGWIVVVAAATLPLLVLSAWRVVNAARPRPLPGGEAGDVFDELAPVVGPVVALRARPWLFAVLVAGAAGALVCLSGWSAEGTLADGLVRGIPEALAVLGAYAVFGRVLALRH